MTPPARLAAAIEILDRCLGGEPLEKALTNWARRSRFAGSKDRAAIRDIVFQCVRCRLSYAARGGGETGRGLVIGYVHSQDETAASFIDPGSAFSGEGYGPPELTASETATLDVSHDTQPDNIKYDYQDWLAPELQASLGADLPDVMDILRHRAPVFLRVNLKRGTRDDVITRLAGEGISTVAAALCETALKVVDGARKVAQSSVFAGGLVELQDAASQAVCADLPMSEGMRVLDYCAGGGGKALALADRGAAVTAHDIDPARMRDLPERARRAGVSIKQIATRDLSDAAPFDLILCDAPCSGSGAWRRAPEGKWSLTQTKLEALTATQAEILEYAAGLLAPGGILAYATCSLLNVENERQIEYFLERNPAWACQFSRRFSPLEGGDGFFAAHLTPQDSAS